MTASIQRQQGATASGIALAEQFRAIAEMSGDIAWTLDCASGKLLYISPFAEPSFGCSLAELELQLVSGEGAVGNIANGLAQRLQRFADGDLTRLQLVRAFDMPRNDGDILPLEITSRLLLDADGKAVMLVGIVRDLSERRTREKERRRFASMLNHEFRTPLSTIDGAIQRLESTHHHADEPTRARYRKIGLATDRLIAMLDDYLSPERMIELGQCRSADALSPSVLLEEGAARAREAGRRVSVEMGELPETIRCDPAGLRLAMKVLVDNAIQYSPGATLITLGAATVPSVSGSAVRNNLELSVSNHGVGLNADEAELAFNKFFRGSNAQGLPGSGLGLYMARSVIEVHGGTVELASVSGDTHTVFKIFLPIRSSGKQLASNKPNSDNPLVTPG
ncbi:MAG: PAS domain-containing sensor histidine kinase [Pseudomonadota bacterium]|nr:PAS domain-containing sensor histidine kinase [Pseudomonadota bacterium]